MNINDKDDQILKELYDIYNYKHKDCPNACKNYETEFGICQNATKYCCSSYDCFVPKDEDDYYE